MVGLMLCQECNKKEYTKIEIGVTERYFCDECHEKWKKNQKILREINEDL
jgi:NMD protein affecting ribosome stability and mRNA decay